MAKTLPEIIADIRAQLGKAKLKAARKVLERARKTAAKNPALLEVEVEVLLAEGGGDAAAKAFASLLKAEPARGEKLLAAAESHLKRKADDLPVRDVVWEQSMVKGQYGGAIDHLQKAVTHKKFDPVKRAQRLAARKDEIGAAAIFMMGSMGGVKLDRLVLGPRLLRNEKGMKLLAGTCTALNERGLADGIVQLMMARIAHQIGKSGPMLTHAATAAQDQRDAVLKWVETVPAPERLALGLKVDSVPDTAAALAELGRDEAAKKKGEGDGAAARALRGLSLLAAGKAENACRILEEVARGSEADGGALARTLADGAAAWPGSESVLACVVASVQASPITVEDAVGRLLQVGSGDRSGAWARGAEHLLKRMPEDANLRRELGLAWIDGEDEEKAAALLESDDHLEIARHWVENSHPGPAVLQAAAGLAEKRGEVDLAAEWMLRASRAAPELLASMGERFGQAALPLDTALETSGSLLREGQKADAAGFLSRLSLDAQSGDKVSAFLKKNKLEGESAFAVPALRTALSRGDLAAARQLAGAMPELSALSPEAQPHPAAARTLAALMILQKQVPDAVALLESRRAAGDKPDTLSDLADQAVRAGAGEGGPFLLRARLRADRGQTGPAVEDLREIPHDAHESEAAFDLLGELKKKDKKGGAVLGRADILVAREQFDQAILELTVGEAPADQRLVRFEAICRSRPDLEAAHRGRAEMLLSLDRVEESGRAHLERLGAADVDPAAVGNDLERVAKRALKEKNVKTVSLVLDGMAAKVPEGAQRAIDIIGDNKTPALLVLKSKLLMHLNRQEDAVRSLGTLAKEDPSARVEASKALGDIIDASQARPLADLTLIKVHELMENSEASLHALTRLYQDNITTAEEVADAGANIIRRADNPDVRLFLAQVALDQRAPQVACEHAVQARKLRPDVRREVVNVLRRCLEQDALDAQTHFSLAEAYLAGDQADDAVRHFHSAVRAEPRRAGPAISVMEAAAPRSGNPALLWLAVGTIQAGTLEDHRKAVAAHTKGLEADPPKDLEVSLLLGRGDSHAKLGARDDAFADFDRASELALLERRFYEFLRKRHRELELAAVKKAKQVTDDFPATVDGCGRLLRLGRDDEAVEMAQAAFAAHPDRVEARYIVGVTLFGAGRYDAAAGALEQVRAEAGPDSELGRAARILLAQCYLDKGDRDRARTALTEIESVNAAYPGMTARRAALAPPADDPLSPPPLFVRPQFPKPGSS